MPVKTESCIFCNGTPVTREDMVPRWILRRFERQFSTPSKVAVKSRSGPAYWESNGVERHTVRCVCATCNNGWMSEIELEAKPTLARMIQGESMTLNTQEQEAVAKWACLKTMIGAYAWGVHPIPDDWLAYFYREHLPPEGWFVLTAAYAGTMTQSFDSYRFGRGAAPTVANRKNILASILIGHLAISVRAIRDKIDLDVRTNLLRLWPSSSLGLRWPPGTLTDDTLPAFRQMGVKDGPHLLDPNNMA